MPYGSGKSEAIDLLVVVMVPVFLPVRIGIKAICSGGLVVPRSGRWIRFWSGIWSRLRRWTECLVSRVELVDKIAWMDMVVADMAVGGRELCHGSGGNC